MCLILQDGEIHTVISFIICLCVLIGGYFIYGRVIEKQFGPDDRPTPAITMRDGVDYVELPEWRIFLIQLLDIAGLGPIWGAVGGAMWGPSVFVWITLGTVFGGMVHDFASGFMSMRFKGEAISDICGQFMGKVGHFIMCTFTIVLLFMVGVVFAKGPAGLLSYLFSAGGTVENFFTNTEMWLIVIVIYYFIATFVSIDAIIGKIYPVFGVCLIIMAFGVGGGIFAKGYASNIPEIWEVIGKNMHPASTNAWPMMFISVACGAISGFHSTQSPIMARCCSSERQSKKIFCGAMVCEGVIALIWAAAACALFPIEGGKMTALQAAMAKGQSSCVYSICSSTMGKVGVVLAMLGVIVCPITTGDTAFRAARMTIAEWFGMEQKSWESRLVVSLPLMALGYLVCQLDYSTIWNYFASTNQILAMIFLWTASIYLRREGRKAWVTVIPATFLSAVTMTCVLSSKLYLGNLFGKNADIAGRIGGVVLAALFLISFLNKKHPENTGHLKHKHD